MVVITVEAYVNTGVHTIKVGEKKLFWLKMIDVQKGLGLKNSSHLVRKRPNKTQIILKLNMYVVILWKK